MHQPLEDWSIRIGKLSQDQRKVLSNDNRYQELEQKIIERANLFVTDEEVVLLDLLVGEITMH